MGTVVFPDALVKVFVTASPEERARRRYKQLIAKGISITMESLLRDIRERDARDAGRAAAPLMPAADAVILDTTDLTIEAAIGRVLGLYRDAAAKQIGADVKKSGRQQKGETNGRNRGTLAGAATAD